MRITLSQSHDRLTQAQLRTDSRQHWRRDIGKCSPHVIAIFALIVLLTTSCNRIETETALDSDGVGTTDFVWPEDPSHPTLALEIAADASAASESGEQPSHRRIQIELMPELAPVTVAHVINLAKENYYDGTTFHRVIPGFMIQGGDPNSRDRDPNNDGNGNPTMQISDEFGDAPFLRGVVGMGNLGRRNSTGSQFFIMHADHRSLDGRYTVIGRVISGMEVVDAITDVSIDKIGRWGPRDRPIKNVLMTRVAIEERAIAPLRVTTGNSGTGDRETDG
jgi:peptidyl-prolyl cis-trans isomerase B (cyclophilin B)